MNKYFYELFTDLPRQGPGDVMLTRQCFESITDMNANLDVLDVGCGTGFQTTYLAVSSAFSIIAVDNYQPYLDELNRNAATLNLSHRLKAINMSMDALSFDNGSFDAVLSEGAIYIMGVENGLKQWKRFLRPNGHIIFSDVCWIKEPKDRELIDFWQQEYPSMMSVEGMEKTISNCGYSIKNKFLLSSNGWVNNYYYPLHLNVIKCRNKYINKPEAIQAVESIQSEIDIFYKYNEYFSYYFFVVQVD